MSKRNCKGGKSRFPINPHSSDYILSRSPLRMEDYLEGFVGRTKEENLQECLPVDDALSELETFGQQACRAEDAGVSLRTIEFEKIARIIAIAAAHDGIYDLRLKVAKRLKAAGVKPDKRRGLFQGIAMAHGKVRDSSTLVKWGHAGAIILPQVQCMEDIARLLKEYGGIRKASDAYLEKRKAEKRNVIGPEPIKSDTVVDTSALGGNNGGKPSRSLPVSASSEKIK